MRTYLIHHNGKGRLQAIELNDWSGEDLHKLRMDFAREAGGPDQEYGADMTHLAPENITTNGVWFDWELAGPDGAAFMLIKLPDVTDEAIEKAKREIRRDRDVVRMRVLKIKELI